MLKKNQKTYFKIAVGFALIILAIAAFLFVPKVSFAGDADNMLWGGQSGNFQAATGLGNVDIRVTIARIIRYILGFMGIISVVIIMYGGWVYMTSGGDENKISQAKKIIVNSVVGLIIVLMSFGIATFVINRFLIATGAISSPTSAGRTTFGLGATGNSVIENHYPSRNQKNVPRNTMIVITFREPMNEADLISAGNISSNILIYVSATEGAGPFVTNVAADLMPDMKTLRLDPNDLLGSPSENVWYTVALTTAIHKANGDLAFPGASGGYSWTFEVSTLVDITPPHAISVIPVPGLTEPRNVVVQINFNEPVDPISASGQTPTFNNISVNNNSGVPVLVEGNFYISNLYRTVEFLTEDECGVNSCGQTIYCLPGNSNLSVLIRAATLLAGGPTADTPYNGVVDMCGNSLDGNVNNLAEGPEAQSSHPPYNLNSPDPLTQGDDCVWSFSTNNNIDITAPVIDIIAPASNSTNVGLDTVPEATFSKYLMSSSLTRNAPPIGGSVALYADPSTSGVFYWMEKANGSGRTVVYIMHENFWENSYYTPEFNSGIKDIYQNCYNPGAGPGCTPVLPAQPYCCDGSVSATNCAP